jgi:hypothetical protein
MGFGGHYILNKGFVANEALTQFRFVKGGAGTRNVDACDTQGELALGVCQEDVSAADATNGRVTNVALLGVTLVEAGAAITQYAEVTTEDDGTAMAAVSGDRVLGIALDAAGGAAEWIAVLLTPAGRVV